MTTSAGPVSTSAYPPPRRRRLGDGRLAISQRTLYGLIGVVVVLAVWEGVSRAELISPILISRPSEVAATAINEFTTGAILPALQATLSVWIIGFSISAVLGIAIGLLAGRFRRFRYIAVSWLNASYVAPDLAFVPILVLWFGIGVRFKIVLVVLTGIYYVATNTLAGAKSAEGRFLRVANSFGASEFRIMRTVILPGSVPYIIAGLRLASARTIIAVILAEFVSSNAGIGYEINLAGAYLDTAMVMFGISLLAILSFIVGEILSRIERHFASWRPERT